MTPERAACLAPPYVPENEQMLEDGIVAARDGSQGYTVMAPGASFAIEQTGNVLDELRAHEGLRTLSLGACQERSCFRLRSDLCTQTYEDILSRFRAAWAESNLQGIGFVLKVELIGRLGPRCAPSDSLCQPIPYETDWCDSYDPNGNRYGGVLRRYSMGACTHDGDCNVGGCGNHCLAWQVQNDSNRVGTCEGYAFRSPVFCGCVEGSCSWFSQRASL